MVNGLTLGGETIDVINPATGEPIGAVAHARTADLDLALEAAKSGFEVWKKHLHLADIK